MELNELIKEVLNKGISIDKVEYNKKADSLVYYVAGFSKSGYAEVYSFNGVIYCKTRYDTIDEINSFEDLMKVAYKWNKEYARTEPFGWDKAWAHLFKEAGWDY